MVSNCNFRTFNIILGNTPSNSEISAGDLNDDEIINVLDIILIVNIILNS